MQRGVFRFSVSAPDAGQRLDQYLSAVSSALSRSFVRRVIDFGGVHINGKRTRSCSHSVRDQDQIEVFCDGLPLQPFALTPSLTVFRDSYLLVLNKPAGIDCQPTPSRFKGTVYSALYDVLANPRQPRQRPPIGMVQRLDRDTSGLLVFSIHERAHQGLTQQFTERTVHKTYLAIVAGQLAAASGEFRSCLAKNRATNLMKSVEKGGREAVTRYRTLATCSDASLVEVDLLTGRSHQIRVHFSEAGHPLLGDVRYGGPADIQGHSIDRQLLHAAHLSFCHPISGQTLTFDAQLPVDMSFFARLLFEESL
jgi:23S rRNA pseudouridine1911/1915/1917 synthase